MKHTQEIPIEVTESDEDLVRTVVVIFTYSSPQVLEGYGVMPGEWLFSEIRADPPLSGEALEDAIQAAHERLCSRV